MEICQLNSIETAFDDQKRISAGRITVRDEIYFEKKVFLSIIEAAIDSITKRSEALKKHNEMFAFLYDYKNYDDSNKANGTLLVSCKNMEKALSHEGKSDIDADELFIVSTLIEKYEIVHAIDILNATYTQNMENLVPNAVISFRISLTIPASVASGERSFSKLKLIKTYLRNSMGQDRLNKLAIISIEKEIRNLINVIDDFASKKARKKKF